ncbi:MAG: amino acid permease [Chitinophagales bacterium]
MSNDLQNTKRRTFGTMAGVFTPTTLTILGVIMYIRQPWVVGNAGIIGAILIVLISVSITFATALSISSITTNVKIGSGGAFSVISQSLGLEIGGAIGIPFYLAQAVAVAMYVFGFREGLQSILPEINPILLDIGTFSLVMLIAFISTSFAFKIQYIILGIIALSLISIVGGLFVNDLNYNFEWFGKYPGSIENNFSGSKFWTVFAVYFPAVTGVMAGANMSGDLTSPRKSIPLGTISAIILTTIIYLGLIFVAALLATPEELVSNYNVFIDHALFPPIVLAGLLGATLSSALGSFVGAPRIMLALGEKKIVPKSNFISKVSPKGEPYNAMILTAVIVLCGISLRNLNTIAPLLTMFFMITYAMVNVVALIEQSLGLPSYRPTLKIPIIVPLVGAIGSITVMFIMNPVVALFSIILIVIFYFYLVKKHLESSAGDSRSGLFTALAEWATKKTSELNSDREVRSWRPDILIPVSYPRDLSSSYKLIESIVQPKGSIKLVAIKNENEAELVRLKRFLAVVSQKFKRKNVPISTTFIDNHNFNDSLNISMQALNAAFFKPNTILTTVDINHPNLEQYNQLIDDVQKNKYGLIYYIPYQASNLAIENNITLWINNLPSDYSTTYNLGNNDLSILLSIIICRKWKGSIKINLAHENISAEEIESFKEMIRFPKNTSVELVKPNISEVILNDKVTDLNIISITKEIRVKDMIDIVNSSRISALFCSDSGYESAYV